MTAPSETSAKLPAIGDRIAGKYRIEQLIGRGGMGVVFAAEHEILHQRVAIKFLLPERADDPSLAIRLLNEARAAARIRSEHVARVLDVDELPEGGAFIVLEYLIGMNLADALDRRGRLPVVEAAHYIIEMLEALAHAHSLGIVHRDLKPSNLFLAERPDGTVIVKVLDFGVSKLRADLYPNLLNELTQTSALVGSPLFMAPEQVRDARSVDARADIWSIGVVLFKLLTGTLPFDADSLGGAFAAVFTDTPKPLRALAPEVPEALERVVLRCLQKSRDDRFADVGELALALEPFAPEAKPLVLRIGRTLQVARSSPPPRAMSVIERVTPSSPQKATPAAQKPPPAATPSASASGTLASNVASSSHDSSFARAPTLASESVRRADEASSAKRRASAVVVTIGAIATIGAGVAAFLALRPSPPTVSPVAIEPTSPPPVPEDMTPRARAVPRASSSAAVREAVVAPLTAPRSCSDVRDKGIASDGTYRIDPDGAGPLRPFDVHCHGMGDAARKPREYLTLVHSAATGEAGANAVTYVWSGGPCACPDLTRTFDKVRIDLAELSIDVTDATFATYARPLDCEMRDQNHCGARIDIAYGGAGSCRARGDSSGKASIDLRGTPFALAPSARFVPSGFAAAGSATIALDRKTAELAGGGLCGAMASATAPKIALAQDR